MLDGAQFFFREEAWKEAKLGRLFSARSHIEQTSQRNWIQDAIYVAHRGSSDEFLEKFSYYLVVCRM